MKKNESPSGTVFLIPCPITEGKIDSLSKEAIDVLHQTTHFIVERAKSARHFIKASGHPQPIASLQIHEISENRQELDNFLQHIFQGKNIGIISEAGCPGIADPGAKVVSWAHISGVKVVPLVGPSSILMALISSGMNGQNFAFNGYLSNKKPELIQQLKALETKIYKTGQTQIFMETPYRNDFIISTLLESLRPETYLCIACDINSPHENICKKRIFEWKKDTMINYHKRLCIFIIGTD